MLINVYTCISGVFWKTRLFHFIEETRHRWSFWKQLHVIVGWFLITSCTQPSHNNMLLRLPRPCTAWNAASCIHAAVCTYRIALFDLETLAYMTWKKLRNQPSELLSKPKHGGSLRSNYDGGAADMVACEPVIRRKGTVVLHGTAFLCSGDVPHVETNKIGCLKWEKEHINWEIRCK